MLTSQIKLEKAITFYESGVLGLAKTLCEEILMAEPNHAEALHLLGIIAYQTNNPQQALELIERAIQSNSDNPSFYFNRGNLLRELKQLKKAVENYDIAIRLNPNFAEAHLNRGNTLMQLRQLKEAVKSYDQVIAIKPLFVEAFFNRGNAFQELQQWEAATQDYDRAIALKPNYAEAYYNKALMLLSMKDFKQGWDLYEWRLTVRKMISPALNKIPVWDGKKMAGRLLVLPEQGLGDEIFFAAMLNDLRKIVDNITVRIDPRLISLYQRSFDQIEFISKESPLAVSEYNAYIYMASLGRYFRATKKALRTNVKIPFLKACPDKTQKLGKRISSDKKLICGLSWVSKNAEFGFQKTLQLQNLKSVLELSHIDFVDLQYGDTDEEQSAFCAETGIRLKRLSDVDNFQDIDGLASLIDVCDIVLTVSNTTAHLAGALGKPVIVMLPGGGGLFWYWHEGQNNNPWYTTATLIRQPDSSDGESAMMEQVKQVLIAELNKHFINH